MVRPANATLLVALCVTAGVAQSQVPASVESLAWLSGCWAADGKDAGSGEYWTAPAGGTMLGLSRTVKGDKPVNFEFMQLRVGQDGRLIFVALPSGQKEAVFTAVGQTSDGVTFENISHDFPQRVIYTQQPNDRLVARIEGTRSGAFRSIEFPMRRTACAFSGPNRN